MSHFHDSTQEELRLLGEEFKRKFSIPYLQTLANETGMVRRKRKCRAQDLVSLCVFLISKIDGYALYGCFSKIAEELFLQLFRVFQYSAIGRCNGRRITEIIKLFYKRMIQLNILRACFDQSFF